LTTQYYQVGRYIATYVGVGEFKFREKLREKIKREERNRTGTLKCN
jgi:hypothetical protein